MNSNYIIFFVLLFLIIIPWITRQKRIGAIRHVLNRKKQNKENYAMKDLARQFIGKECIIYTVMGMDSGIQGTIKEVSDGGIIGGPRLAGIADKLKQADGAGAVLVQPEECPHEVLGAARAKRVEVLALYPKCLGNLVQQFPFRNTVVCFILGDTIVRSLFLKTDSQPQFLLRHASKSSDFLDFFSYCHMFHRL